MPDSAQSSFLSQRIVADSSFATKLKSHDHDEVEEALWGAVEHLRRLLWDCHCNASDGVPVPFERWLMDDGPNTMPADVEELRDAYDTHTERMDAAEAENKRLRKRLALLERRSHPMDFDSPAYD